MSRLRVRPQGPLAGTVRLPGDLHVGQQALLWAALAEGPSSIAGLSPRSDHATLIHALRALGVPIAQTRFGVRVAGVGLRGLRLPHGALQAGASETTLEILVSLLAAQQFGTRIEAQGRALARSLRSVVTPLRARGANVMGRTSADGDTHAPVSVAPLLSDELLHEVEIEIPAGDPATKLALLVSGLYARGITAIAEGMLSRDHTERALVSLGVPVQTLGGMTVLDTSEGAPRWSGFDWTIPGDFTLASLLIALVLAVPGSDVRFENVLVNRSRAAWLDLVSRAGARIDVTPKGDLAGNEPVAEVRVRSGNVRSLRVAGELAFRMLDEVPALFALGPSLGGRVSVRDVAALRERPGDGLRALTRLARSFGVECTDYQDGFDLDAAGSLEGAVVSVEGSGELALCALALGLGARGETVLEHVQCLDALYPGAVPMLVSLGANIAREETS